MKIIKNLALLLTLLAAAVPAQQTGPGEPPQAGPVEILTVDQVVPGMQAWAWTTFSGTTPEAVPVEILGRLHNAWGPGQDIILAKLGGKAERTNVAGGMSGSPVYHDGRLLGAIALRFSTFSPDAIAGITPIEHMLEINEIDASRPGPSVWARPSRDGAESAFAFAPPITALSISGAQPDVLEALAPSFSELGVRIQSGAASTGTLARGASEGALRPGEPIAAVLLAGDLSATALGTVSYNDGRKVLGFGHAMFNAGPIRAPLATGHVLLTLASQLNPVKIANAVSVVGSLEQDRHSGILGVLGGTAELAPVKVRLRNLGADDAVLSEKTFSYGVVRHEKWTAQLLMMALFNSVFGVNEHADDVTFRVESKLSFEGGRSLDFKTLHGGVPTGPAAPPLLLAGAIVNRLQRVMTNVRETPLVESVEVNIDLLPERRTASIEQLWVENRRVKAGDVITGRVALQPYRGPRMEKHFSLRVPPGAGPGSLILQAGDVSVYEKRNQLAAQRSASLKLSEALDLLNQEGSNDQVYLSLVDRTPTARLDNGVMPAVPPSMLAVLRSTAQGRLSVEPYTPLAEQSLPVDAIVTGSRMVSIEVE